MRGAWRIYQMPCGLPALSRMFTAALPAVFCAATGPAAKRKRRKASTRMNRLDRERRSAAAAAARIWIVEGEATRVEALLKVDFHAVEVNAVRFFHQHGNTADFKPVVIRFRLIKAENIAQAAATTALNANAQGLRTVE